MPRSRALSWGVQIAAVSFVLFFFLMSSTSALADTDPPGRVARLSYLSGDVSMQPNGVDEWTEAKLNRPLTTSDRLWTAKDSRAELQIGNSTLRLNGETSFTLANLDDRTVQVQLAQGALNVHISKLYDDETFEIDTPNFTVNLLRSGDYRIDVDSEGDTSWITVREGTAQANGSGQTVTVHPRQQAKFAGGNNGTYDVAGAPAPDGFDEWARARDKRQEEAKSARYVSRDMIGYDDLDDYGTWRTYDTYGAVWVPRTVVVGWAPYRYGHWEWIHPWGWTWIDDAPWGFAPFHYGRWVYAPFGWAWVPGPRYYRPYYAPALVAWVGGRSWGVGISFGGGYGVGWLPLGPREMYVPWYRASRNHWTNVNVHNTYINNTYITNIYNSCRGDCDGSRQITNINYRNREHGMTAMPHDAFVHSRPVGKYSVRLTPDAARRAPVMARVDGQPGREAILGGRERPREARPPERAFQRPLVMKNTPPKPVRFDSDARAFPGGPVKAGDRPDRAVAGGPERTGADNRASRPERNVPRPPVRAGEMQGNRPAAPHEAHDANRPDHPGEGSRPNSEANRVVPRPPERGVERGGNAPADRADRGEHPDRVVPRPSGDRPVRDVEVKAERVPKPSGDEVRVPRAERPAREAESNGDRVPRPSREAENRVPRPEREITPRVDRGERDAMPERSVSRPERPTETHVRRAPVESIRNTPSAGREVTTPRQAPRESAPSRPVNVGRSAPASTQAPARSAEAPRASSPRAERGAPSSGDGGQHRNR